MRPTAKVEPARPFNRCSGAAGPCRPPRLPRKPPPPPLSAPPPLRTRCCCPPRVPLLRSPAANASAASYAERAA